MQNTSSNTISISEAVEACLKKNLVFAAYRLPNSQHPEMVIQKSPQKRFVSNSDSYFDMRGFLVEPFSESDNCPAFIIEPDIYATESLSIEDFQWIQKLNQFPVQSDETHIPEQIDKNEYIRQIDYVIDQIEKGSFEKVVLSRIKILEGDYVSELNIIFSKLMDAYPNAFVSIFNAGPDLWVGASPEPLLRAHNGTMYTVSLAGTRTNSEQNLNIGAWNSKERLEQEYVTRYISRVLSKFNLIDVNLEGPYTKTAGNLVHLRTDFSFRSAELKYCLGEFLNNLHPTPAVCGMPRKESLDLILDLEKHDREYYSGFLGPVGLNNRLSLFVNLRCMKVLQNNLALYVGGGITADSVPDDEWQETEIKADTIMSVIPQVKA